MNRPAVMGTHGRERGGEGACFTLVFSKCFDWEIKSKTIARRGGENEKRKTAHDRLRDTKPGTVLETKGGG